MKTMALLAENPLIEALGWTLVHSIWQIALGTLLALGLLAATHQKKAHVRYTLLVLVLMGICMTSAVTFVRHYNPGTVLKVMNEQIQPQTLQHEADVRLLPASLTSNLASTGNRSQESGLRLWFVSYFEKHLPALVAIWFLGFVFLFLKYVGGMVWMLRLRSIAQPVSESIQELIIKLSLKLNVARLVRGASSLKIVTPIVIGHAKPMILFPATVLTGLSAEQLETIILHELAHINRNDYLVNLIQSFLETVFFFHPGIWWLSSALRTEREHACDDMAIQGGASEMTLARSLTEMAALSLVQPRFAVAFAGNQKKLKQRIQRLIIHETMKTNFKIKAFLATIIVVVVCLVSFAYTKQKSEQELRTEQNVNNANGEEPREAASGMINQPDAMSIQNSRAELRGNHLSALQQQESNQEVAEHEPDDRQGNLSTAANASNNLARLDISAANKINSNPLPDENKPVQNVRHKTNSWGADPSIVKKFNQTDDGKLSVQTSGGSIELHGGNGSEVEVQAFVKVDGHLLKPNDPMLDELKAYYEIKIEKSGNTVIAHAKRTSYSSLWKRANISFIVFAPTRVASKLLTSGGSIQADALKGDQSLKTSGGSIRIESVTGVVDATTSGGSIQVKDQKGHLTLHTSGGSITVDKAYGTISGHTSGGGIHLTDILGEAEVSTSGGGISVIGYAEYLSASTSGGSIQADITGLSRKLELTTSGGSIRVSIPKGLGMDLDLKGNKVSIPLENFSGQTQKNAIQGKMNGGGIPVVLRTSGGGVTVSFQ